MKKELCVKLVIYKNYTEMHGQQNIKTGKQVSNKRSMCNIVARKVYILIIYELGYV
jgi:hypothetical protein